jgi:Ca2+/Na+ antiporter
MKIDLKNWKIGAGLGALVPVCFGALFVFDNPHTQGLLVATLAILASSMFFFTWAAYRSQRRVIRGVFAILALLWIAVIYFFLFGGEEVSNCCTVDSLSLENQAKMGSKGSE